MLWWSSFDGSWGRSVTRTNVAHHEGKTRRGAGSRNANTASTTRDRNRDGNFFLKKIVTYPTMYERVVNQLFSTESCQFARSQICIFWSRDFGIQRGDEAYRWDQHLWQSRWIPLRRSLYLAERIVRSKRVVVEELELVGDSQFLFRESVFRELGSWLATWIFALKFWHPTFKVSMSYQDVSREISNHFMNIRLSCYFFTGVHRMGSFFHFSFIHTSQLH